MKKLNKIIKIGNLLVLNKRNSFKKYKLKRNLKIKMIRIIKDNKINLNVKF